MADGDENNSAQDELENDEQAEQTGGISAQSVLRGLRDTAAHMLSEARAEAGRAKDEAWQRYESKTKYRREKD